MKEASIFIMHNVLTALFGISGVSAATGQQSCSYLEDGSSELRSLSSLDMISVLLFAMINESFLFHLEVKPHNNTTSSNFDVKWTLRSNVFMHILFALRNEQNLTLRCRILSIIGSNATRKMCVKNYIYMNKQRIVSKT